MGSKQQAARCGMPGGVGHPRSWMLGRVLAVSPPTARLAVCPKAGIFFSPCQNNLANCSPNLGWHDNSFWWVKSHAGARLAALSGCPGLGVSFRRLLVLVVQPSHRRPCRICITCGGLAAVGWPSRVSLSGQLRTSGLVPTFPARPPDVVLTKAEEQAFSTLSGGRGNGELFCLWP